MTPHELRPQRSGVPVNHHVLIAAREPEPDYEAMNRLIRSGWMMTPEEAAQPGVVIADGTDCILITVRELGRLRRIETATREALLMVLRQREAGDVLLDDSAQVYVALAELQDAVLKCTPITMGELPPDDQRTEPKPTSLPVICPRCGKPSWRCECPEQSDAEQPRGP